MSCKSTTRFYDGRTPASVGAVRTTTRLAGGDGFAIAELRIVERATAWSEPAAADAHRLVFVRRGLFRLRLPGWEGLADPVTAYVTGPGDPQSIAHRPHAEDICTVITLAPALVQDVPLAAATRPILTTGRIDLAQRALVARAHQGADEFELAERVVHLAADLRTRQSGPPAERRSTPVHRQIVASARELLVDDPAAPSLGRLAAQLTVSRSYLSRVFHQETGETLTRFRNRLRVRAALDRLAAGHPDLAGLAADLGFADHAHLTRALRAEVGSPPSRVRDLLAGYTEHKSSSG